MQQPSVVTFACQECGRSISFPADRCGHVETCPHCYEYVDVPSTPSEMPSVQTAPAADSAPHDPFGAQFETRRLWFEVIAVLALAVVPDLYSAAYGVLLPTKPRHVSALQEFWIVIRAFQVSLPVLVILNLNREPWAKFGFVRFSWRVDVPAGLLIWMCALAGYIAVISLVPVSLIPVADTDDAVRWAKPAGLLGGCLVLAVSVANGFAEELVMRGYLLTRFERLLHSTPLAVLVTTALFASYHVYQGPAGLIHAAAVGLIYGTIYSFQRRLWPVCIAHAIADIVGTLS